MKSPAGIIVFRKSKLGCQEIWGEIARPEGLNPKRERSKARLGSWGGAASPLPPDRGLGKRSAVSSPVVSGRKWSSYI